MPTDAVSTFGTLDAVLLGVLALSALVGLFRGLTFELLSLAGWFVAYFAARASLPYVAPLVPVGTAGSALNHGVAFACAFLVVLVVWGLAARALSSLVAATPLRPLDRVLGAVFGLLRGALVLLVVATVVAYSPLRQAETWRESAVAGWLNAALLGLAPWLPERSSPPSLRPERSSPRSPSTARVVDRRARTPLLTELQACAESSVSSPARRSTS